MSVPKLTRAQREWQKKQAATLVFLRSKADAYATGSRDFDSTCFKATELASAINVSEIEAHELLRQFEESGLVEYHRPHEVPAYWRATNKASSEVQP